MTILHLGMIVLMDEGWRRAGNHTRDTWEYPSFHHLRQFRDL